MTTVPLRAAAAGACLAVAMSACVAPGLASPSPSGPDASAPPAVVTPSPSPVVTPTPSPASDILVHVIPASADVPFGYVGMEILKRGPTCGGKFEHPEPPDPGLGPATERAALALAGDGLVSEDPPAYVGDVRAAAKAFGGFEVFVQQSAKAREAWVVRLATAADWAHAPQGTPMAVGMFRHELPDGRTAWVLSRELVTLDC
jgi:hypothetical protein